MLYELSCPHCQCPVSAESGDAGRWVRCPICQGEFQLTPPPGDPCSMAPATIPAGSQTPMVRRPAAPVPRRFPFACPRCESVLEAHTGQSGLRAKCPTCDTEFVVPQFDPRSGLTGEFKGVTGQPQDPTPVHAYAADGARAPRIVCNEAGEQRIRCPRCGHESPITANRCQPCGLPFTLEGVTHDVPPGSSNGYAVISMVMGLLGLPCFILVIPQILAVVFGVVALSQIRHDKIQRGRGLAWAGIALGAVCLAVAGISFFVLHYVY